MLLAESECAIINLIEFNDRQNKYPVSSVMLV